MNLDIYYLYQTDLIKESPIILSWEHWKYEWLNEAKIKKINKKSIKDKFMQSVIRYLKIDIK